MRNPKRKFRITYTSQRFFYKNKIIYEPHFDVKKLNKNPKDKNNFQIVQLKIFFFIQKITFKL